MSGTGFLVEVGQYPMRHASRAARVRVPRWSVPTRLRARRPVDRTRIRPLFVVAYDASSLIERDRAMPCLTGLRVEAVTIATVSALCGQGDTR
jgi:hypothetical protein